MCANKNKSVFDAVELEAFTNMSDDIVAKILDITTKWNAKYNVEMTEEEKKIEEYSDLCRKSSDPESMKKFIEMDKGIKITLSDPKSNKFKIPGVALVPLNRCDKRIYKLNEAFVTIGHGKGFGKLSKSKKIVTGGHEPISEDANGNVVSFTPSETEYTYKHSIGVGNKIEYPNKKNEEGVEEETLRIATEAEIKAFIDSLCKVDENSGNANIVKLIGLLEKADATDIL